VSNLIIQSETLNSIANAIREKNGEQTTYTPSEMITAISNISSGGSDYNVKMGTVITSNYNSVASNIKEVPLLDISQLTSLSGFFQDFKSLETVPLLDTSHITNMSNMVTRCWALSDESLDNILQMCINATSYTATKSLYAIGIKSTNYPHEKIQALPHYQDFINAGWSI